MKRLARLLMVLVVTASFYNGTAQAAAAQVTVYYFHSTIRCVDCLEIERLAGDVLQRSFPRELASGQLIWNPVNVDLPENTHFVFDYDLAANELVVAQTDPPGNFLKLFEVWNLARQHEQFRAELVRLVGKALLKVDKRAKGGPHD